jgi:3-hydroxyacyl-[acyl-carrier-protein] dehydratase
MLTKSEIADYLEITDPFLMIDEIHDLIPGISARGIKHLSMEDWFFNCHLQRALIMPGTLIIEAMLQTLVLTIYTRVGHQGKLTYIRDIKTKLLVKVGPEQTLEIRANLLTYKHGISKGEAIVIIAGQTVAQGEFTLVSPHEMPQIREKISL